MTPTSKRILITSLAALLLASCAQPVAHVPTLPPTTSDTPGETIQNTPVPSPTLPPSTYYIQPGVPQEIADVVEPALAEMGFTPSAEPGGTSIQVTIEPSGADLTALWTYALVAPFPTVIDELSWSVFAAYWAGDLGTLSGDDGPPRLILTSDVAGILIHRLGPPAENVPLDLYQPDQLDQLAGLAFDSRPALSIIPFDRLTPQWKVLSIDGLTPLDKQLDLLSYPLFVPVGVFAADEAGEAAANRIVESGAWPVSNRDQSKMTTVVMTGVTALARATAMQIELKGAGFPSEMIRPFFADADILHTSNEVSFSTECPEPEWTGPPKFCAQRDYFEVLEIIGLDIVELTGNHNLDWGAAAANYTLDVYDGSGLPYYGGGRDLEDAQAPRILTAPDGTRFAFIGCNSAGPYTAWATTASPGAAPCDDWVWMTDTIAMLKTTHQAEIVIATVQYQERDSYEPSLQQIEDFQRLAAAGADIVSGSQAHQPQGFSFAYGSFIHYGVGNLFFDQMDYVENRQMFADKHIFYQGRHISTVLFTGMMEAWAQPRPMTAEERAEFLSLIFDVSEW